MLNLNYELEAIIKKYRFSINSINTDVEKTIKDIWDRISADRNIAIWGAGDHTNELMKLINHGSKNLVCVFDKGVQESDKKHFGDYPIYNPTKLTSLNIDVIFISSFAYKEEIKKEATSIKPECECIDIYEVLIQKGIILNTPFYYDHSDYMEIFNERNLYENSVVHEVKEKHLHKLICKYLQIRDFKYALFFIEEYIKKGYSRKSDFIAFRKELEELFIKVKKELSNRKHKDIVWFLIDSLRHKDIEDAMPFTKKILRQSIYFKNAFSTNLFTYMSVFSMLTQKLPIDEELYKKDVISAKESEFLTFLINNDYKIKSYVLGKELFEVHDKIDQVKTKRRIAENKKDTNDLGVFVSTLLWRSLCDLLQNKDEAIFSLLHIVGEVHKPHICGYHEKKPVIHNGVEQYCYQKPEQSEEDFKTQFYDCIKYVDNQLNFYMDFYPSNTVKIISGDHGQAVDNIFKDTNNLFLTLGCSDERIHIPFIINMPDGKVQCYDDVFNMKYGGKVLTELLSGQEIKIEENFAEFQFEAYFNKALAKKLREVGAAKYINGFKGIRTCNYKYVVYNEHGAELYKLPDETTNIISEMTYANVLKELQQKMENQEFPNFE